MKGIFFILLTLLCVTIFGEQHPHTDRPEISEVNAAKMANPPTAWGKVKDGSVGFVAELLSLYPEGHFYFLARDSEYMYDMAKALTQNDKAASKRFHLLHISRKMMNDPLLPDYLKQEGVTRSDLGSKGYAVFIDTGWRGQIPTHLVNLLPKVTSVPHMLHSDDGSIPSSRVFIESLVKNVDTNQTTNHHQQIVDHVEHLPHFSDRALQLIQKGGKIIPVTTTVPNNRQSAVKLMGDIKEYANNPDVQKRFMRLREDMGDLVALATGDIKMSDQEIADLLRRLETTKGRFFLDDFKETLQQNLSDVRIRKNFWNQISDAQQLEGSAARRNKAKLQEKTKPISLADIYKEGIKKGVMIELSEVEKAEVIEVIKEKSGMLRLIAENKNGNRYEVVTTQKEEPISKTDFTEFMDHIQKLDDFKISQPSVVKSDEHYLVRALPDGEKGDEWVKAGTWKKAKSTPLIELANFIADLSKKGIYIGNIRSEDLYWNSKKKEWQVLNFSYIKDGEDPAASMDKYLARMGSRWAKKLGEILKKELSSCRTKLGKVAK